MVPFGDTVFQREAASLCCLIDFNVPILNLQLLVCIFVPFKNSYYKNGK